MASLAEFGSVIIVNAILLIVAAHEFRRRNITVNVFSARYVIALCTWTLAEMVARRNVYELLVFAAVMGAIGVSAITDEAGGYVLDVVTLPSCAFSIVMAAYNARAIDSLAGAVAASGALFSLHAVTRGQGLGLGDVKLAAVSGALLGTGAGLFALGTSFVLGGCVAMVLIATKRVARKTAVPFAPYIAAGTLAAVFLRPA
jgi:prepilin signal peptidase PulO-like enzyme (type II secretory pathway)